MTWLNEFDERLAALDAQSLRRVRRPVVPESSVRLNVDGESLLAFCSNDYLGLAQDPLLRQAVHAAVDRYGVGSGASPMVSGHSMANVQLELELAEAVGLPRALYFYAGYATNASVVPALVGAGDEIFSDAANHACLIDGARLSKATVHRFPHGDLARLDELLNASRAVRKLVISDAVFSMDGTVVDLAGLHRLCERYDALLLIDDAHGFGVLGPNGRGALAAAGLIGAQASPRVLCMATLGKALGVAGAFVAGPERLVEWLLQKTRSYTYATAAPAMLAEAVRAGLRCVLSDEGGAPMPAPGRVDWPPERGLGPRGQRRIRCNGLGAQHVIHSHSALADRGQRRGSGGVLALRRQGLWVPAIRPPTVPAGTARLRIALSAAHLASDVDLLLAAIYVSAGAVTTRRNRPKAEAALRDM